PVGLKGALIAGVFAASMSSLASSMNSLATVSVNDFYRRFVKNVPDARALLTARILTGIFGIFATASSLYVATTRPITMLDLFLDFLGLVGGGLAAIYVLGTCTKRANGAGVLIGAATSGVVMYFIRTTSLNSFFHAAVGFTTCFVVGYFTSLLFPSAEKPA